LGANIDVMVGDSTNKTTIGGKTEIGIGIGQTRQSVESHTTNGDHDGQREQGFREELKGMRGVRHGGRN
jgi:hypothetical protein